MKPEYPQRILNSIAAKDPRQPNTYCMEVVEGVRCHAPIPLTETLCVRCKEKKATPIKP